MPQAGHVLPQQRSVLAGAPLRSGRSGRMAISRSRTMRTSATAAHSNQAAPQPRKHSSSPTRRAVAAEAVAGFTRAMDRPAIVADTHFNPLATERKSLPPRVVPFRKTKLVCTIGPATWDREKLFKLADAGMNVARLNMSHGDHASHKKVVDLIKEYNTLGRGCVALMLDTKGPEVRSGDLSAPIDLVPGQKYTFTIDEGATGEDGRISVNYDGFINDVSVGDIMLVDGGLSTLKILSKTSRDVQMEVVDGGKLTSRRHLNIRGKSANLPAITDKDWLDLKFGIDVGVDYYALSFVRSADVIYELKDYLAKQGANIGVLAKIESAESVGNLNAILDAVDGAMVARGDLGAELPVEEVPFWQSRIVQGCRRRGKPVIVATNMLESMITNPTPTRAEVSDIAIAVREGTDAIMLSGESAYGKFPYKSVDVMATVAKHTEQSMLSYAVCRGCCAGTRRFGSDEAEPIDWIVPPARDRLPSSSSGAGSSSGGSGSGGSSTSNGAASSAKPSRLSYPGLSEMFAYHATTMANTIRTSLLVFSRKGNMPTLLSHYRPDMPIYCFTESREVQRRLALYHGVTAIYLKFLPSANETFDRAIEELKRRSFVEGGQQVAIVQSGRQPIWRSASTHVISVREVPLDPEPDEL